MVLDEGDDFLLGVEPVRSGVRIVERFAVAGSVGGADTEGFFQRGGRAEMLSGWRRYSRALKQKLKSSTGSSAGSGFSRPVRAPGVAAERRRVSIVNLTEQELVRRGGAEALRAGVR